MTYNIDNIHQSLKIKFDNDKKDLLTHLLKIVKPNSEIYYKIMSLYGTYRRIEQEFFVGSLSDRALELELVRFEFRLKKLIGKISEKDLTK